MGGHGSKLWGLLDHGTLKLGVSHKWFYELSRLIECSLHTDSDGRIFGLTANILCLWHLSAGCRKLKVASTILGLVWLQVGVATQVTRLENWLYLKNVLLKKFD